MDTKSAQFTLENGYAAGVINAAKSGWTIIGIIGYSINTTYVMAQSLMINNSNIGYTVRHIYNQQGADSATLYVKVLYQKQMTI